MRILIVHNYYQDPGGEDEVFRLEKLKLSETEEVRELSFINKKGWKGFFQFMLYPFNFIAKRKIEAEIEHFKPEIVHFHNLHYAVGPIAIRVIKKRNIPMVMTLHNYRLICPSATLFSNGNIFLDSVKASFPWKAVKLGLSSNSAIKTFWFAFGVWLHKKIGTWNMVDRYIVLTDFAKQLFIDSSLNVSPSKFVVKPNFIINPNFAKVAKQDHFLFVGRLTEEKGINVLLQTALKGNFKLRIAGDGPLKNDVVNACEQNGNITYLGSLAKADILKEMNLCSALIFPSTWFEGMPMTIIEAFACVTPVIASNLGAMQTMITNGENGLLFTVGDASSLLQTVENFNQLGAPQKLQMGENAKANYEKYYAEETNKAQLLGIYKDAIKSNA